MSKKPYETLTVCGTEYHFKITTAHAVALEKKLGTDLLSGTEKIAEIGTLAEYYFAAGASLNDGINKIEDVYQLFDDYVTDGGSLEALQELVYDILLTSGIITDTAAESIKKAREKQLEALQKLLN